MNARPDSLQERTPRLAYDFNRLLLSVAIGVPSAVAAVGLYLAFSGTGLSAVAVFVALFIFSARLTTMLTYAVHYARVTATAGGLTFPGDNGVVFWDCIYLATQVQTTSPPRTSPSSQP
jgi:hypothetical protein